MFGLPLIFTAPLVLAGLITLPIIWYLLRLTPPKPKSEIFPPLQILQRLVQKEETPAKSPWWLTLLRLMLAALLIFAMAGPIWKPQEPVLSADGNIILVVDDGWASGDLWPQIKSKAATLLNEAKSAQKLVTLIKTTNPSNEEFANRTPEEITTLLEASNNIAVKPDHANTAKAVRDALRIAPADKVVFLSDGLNYEGSRELANTISNAQNAPLLFIPDLKKLIALRDISNLPDKMQGTLMRANSSSSEPIRAIGFDEKGLPIARAQIIMQEGQSMANFAFEEPVELRNQIVRVQIEEQNHSGAVQLLDESNRRRIVGLISGQSIDISQPLLSPLYYINRALSPFSDLRQANTSNLSEAVPSLIQQNVSAMVLTDIGNLPEETSEQLGSWVEKGGMLIRFAGPRLAANPQSPLLPIELLEGDRLIGGALSWEEPKEIAPFEQNSPFLGLNAPKEITVKRQVMASQAQALAGNIWARLDDGTPLITAKKLENGWIVLFHVNSDNNWSNLPLSGTFVEMLRRIVNLSQSTNTQGLEGENAIRLPALEILNGQGILQPPSANIKPLIVNNETTPQLTPDNPAGLYGTTDGYVALNVLNKDSTLVALDKSIFSNANFGGYANQQSIDLKSWLILAALILFLMDCIAVLWFAGAFRKGFNMGKKTRPTSSSLASIVFTIFLGLSALTFLPSSATAQKANAPDITSEVEIDFSATLKARIAYVKSGIAQMDEISEAGLRGLSIFTASRTALVPGDPIGLDIEQDELSFYPILYWPIHADSVVPDNKTMARIDSYMKQGGSILFDTRNQISGVFNNQNAPENIKLRLILSSLDIPALEPVPEDHVLTKAFYILDSFPGRYSGGDLWVEKLVTYDETNERPARAGDGVSTILITSNDFAGAWAVDQSGRPLLPTIPADHTQRNYAFRAGVNILMYMMTGNYKADQVHIPALLERLGQ